MSVTIPNMEIKKIKNVVYTGLSVLYTHTHTLYITPYKIFSEAVTIVYL